MLLDRTMVENVIRNSKDKETMIKTLDHLPNMEDGLHADIQVSYDLTIRGSQISNTFCNATTFVDSAGNLWISMYDNDRCSGATLVTTCPSFTKDIGDLCIKGLKQKCPINVTVSKEKIKIKEDPTGEDSVVSDWLEQYVGRDLNRSELLPLQEKIIKFYGNEYTRTSWKIRGLETTRFNAIISTLGYIQTSRSDKNGERGKKYRIEKINK